MNESVVLCEGYNDRAFWAGWLKHLGCREARTLGGFFLDTTIRAGRGHYGFRSKSDRFLRVIPCGGRRHVRYEARSALDDRAFEPLLERLVINVDADTDAHADSAATGLRVQDVQDIAREFDSAATTNGEGDVVLDDGATVVSLVRWETDDPPLPGVPTQQTLERLVCAAFAATYPDRGPVVDAWLESRPDPPPLGPKEPAMSYMAGWYADTGSDGFYRVIWDRGKVVDELRSRLGQCGAWRVAEALAE